jgi:hypothetical protein
MFRQGVAVAERLAPFAPHPETIQRELVRGCAAFFLPPAPDWKVCCQSIAPALVAPQAHRSLPFTTLTAVRIAANRGSMEDSVSPVANGAAEACASLAFAGAAHH